MNVLIVDDDRFVVSALEKKIEWNSLGFPGVFSAHSLLQAQKIFETQKSTVYKGLHRVGI